MTYNFYIITWWLTTFVSSLQLIYTSLQLIYRSIQLLNLDTYKLSIHPLSSAFHHSHHHFHSYDNTFEWSYVNHISKSRSRSKVFLHFTPLPYMPIYIYIVIFEQIHHSYCFFGHFLFFPRGNKVEFFLLFFSFCEEITWSLVFAFSFLSGKKSGEVWFLTFFLLGKKMWSFFLLFLFFLGRNRV